MAVRFSLPVALFAVVLPCAVPAVFGQGLQQSPPNTPPRDGQAAARRAGTAIVRGRIIAGDTGRALRRARVTITAPELGTPRNISTDSDGRYEVKELPAGRYRVSAARSGYLTLQYGQRRPLEQAVPLQVADGQTIADVDFALPRMIVITGRVTDEFGDAIEGVTVAALRSRYWNGQRRLIPTGAGLAQTDDAGQFRLLGLAPGTYAVEAFTRETWTVNEGATSRVMGYAPTYSPGTTSSTEAQRITLGLGKEVNVDFSLVPGPAVTISGTAFDSRGRAFPNVNLREEIRGDNFGRFGSRANTTVAADGTFTLRDIPPGEYTLVAATGRDAERPEAAIVPVTVDSLDLSNIVLTGSEGGSIVGRLLTEDGAVPSIPRLVVNVGPALIGQQDPTLAGIFRSPGSSLIDADGSFSVKGVFGRSTIRVTVPDEWTVKSIVYENVDITDKQIELRSGEVMSDVQVRVTDKVTSLAGATTNAKGQTVSDATVVAFTDDAGRWFLGPRAVRAVRPDQRGRYQLKGLPPGDYLVIAMDYVEDGAWNDPEFLESLRAAATRVALRDASPLELSLTVVTPEPGR